MRLIAGGDSFVWGSELKDHKHGGLKGYSLSTFPAILARNNNLEYCCAAYPGIGNSEIAKRSLDYLSDDSLALISWTWQSRDDRVDSDDVIIYLQNLLLEKNIPFIFTCADNCVLTQNPQIDQGRWFLFPPGEHKGKTEHPRGFYQWAVEEGYKCGPDGHPLEKAHVEAAKLMSDRFLTLINERS